LRLSSGREITSAPTALASAHYRLVLPRQAKTYQVYAQAFSAQSGQPAECHRETGEVFVGILVVHLLSSHEVHDTAAGINGRGGRGGNGPQNYPRWSRLVGCLRVTEDLHSGKWPKLVGVSPMAYAPRPLEVIETPKM
jgi:hypothetical protein